MQKPKAVHYNHKDDTSTLFFDDRNSGRFYMRGGVCWPMMAQIDAVVDVVGYIILCGYEISTGIVHVFEQRDFLVIDNIIDSTTSKIEFHGLASWLNMCWSMYFANTFYWEQNYQLAKKFRLDVSRSKMVEPKPLFFNLDPIWTDEQHANFIIWSAVKKKKLLFETGSTLHNQLEKLQKDDKTPYPAVWALQRAMVGFDRYPYRKPIERDE